MPVMSRDILKLRVRYPNGQSEIQVESHWNEEELHRAIARVTGIAAGCIKLKIGFPPKTLELGVGTVGEILSHGDMLTVETVAKEEKEKSSIPRDDIGESAPQNSPVEAESSIASQGTFVRRRVPDDNSCLFRSVSIVLQLSHSVDSLRLIIAETVGGNPALYNDVFLGKSNAEYQRWITEPNTWGGAIELSILSSYFRTELAAIDIQSLRTDCYGEGQNFSMRGYLLYDGIHYDALALQIAEDLDVTLFPTTDRTAHEAARIVAEDANHRKDYTDTSEFSLRCGHCGAHFKGHREIEAHAQATGHLNFREG
uniref:Ubiquitin thioesterase OTU n=1 Tax=Compsopogon caeruleus TaxID=31354 RepID=A0A7S1XDE3_9RHOD